MRSYWAVLTAFLIFLFVLPSLAIGDHPIHYDPRFDDGTAGTIVSDAEISDFDVNGPDIVGDEFSTSEDSGMQLAPLIHFESLMSKTVYDIDWFDGVAVILASDGVYTYTSDTEKLSPTPIFTVYPSHGIISFYGQGQIFLAIEQRTPDTDFISVTFTYYLATSINSNFGEIGTTYYPVANRIPAIKAKAEIATGTILFGGTAFLAMFDSNTVTILDDTFTWPKALPTHYAFQKYYWDVSILTGEGDRWDFDTESEAWKYDANRVYDVPLEQDIFEADEEAYGTGTSDSTFSANLDDMRDAGVYVPGRGVYEIVDALAGGDTENPRFRRVLLSYHPYQILDICATPSGIYMVGVGGLVIHFHPNNNTAIVELYRGTLTELTIEDEEGNIVSIPFIVEVFNSITTGNHGTWISMNNGNRGIRSLSGKEISLVDCYGIAYHPRYGYMWTSYGEVHIAPDPEMETRPYDYSNILGTRFYSLYPDPGSGHCLMKGNGLQHFELRNYTKEGSYISPTQNFDLTEYSDEGEITVQGYIGKITMDWTDDIPSGTSYSVYVSNNGGDTFIEYTKGEGEKSFSTVGIDYNTIAYKITMESDEFQEYTPTLWNMDIYLKLFKIYVVDIQVQPNSKYNADGEHITYYETYDRVNITSVGTFDADNGISDGALFAWDYGDPNGDFDVDPPPKGDDGFEDNPNIWGGIDEYNGTHAYARPGTYTITLNVTDGDGIESTGTDTVTIHNRLPHADIDIVSPTRANDNVGILGIDTLTLSALASTDFDGTIDEYRWFIGGGDIQYTGAIMNHAFTDVPPAGANYTIQLKVTDDWGDVDYADILVHVTHGDTYPTANYTQSTTKAQVGTTITFTSLSTDEVGYIVNYTWDFGDGTLGNGSIVNHIYEKPGRYIVTHTVIDNKSQLASTNMDFRKFNIQPNPVSGPWIIDSHEVCDGWPVPMEDYILIKDGGWLEIKGQSSIYFFMSYTGQYGITVDEGGKLTCDDSDIYAGWHNMAAEGAIPSTGTGYYYFVNSGEVDITNSKISGVDADKSSNRNGLTQWADGTLNIKDSTIIACEIATISTYVSIPTHNPTMTVTNSELSNSGLGAFISGGESIFTRMDILSNVQGGVTVASGDLIITDNSIIRGGNKRGVEFLGGVLAIDNSTIQFCGNAVEVRDSDLSFNDNIVKGSGNGTAAIVAYSNCYIYRCQISEAYWGVYAIGAQIHAVGCTVSTNYKHYAAASGGRVFIDNWLKVIVTWRGVGVTGAHVKIYMNSVLTHSGKTSSGVYGLILLSYAIVTPSAETFPVYSVSASYSGLIDNKTVDMHQKYAVDGVVTVLFEFTPIRPTDENGAVGIVEALEEFWPWWANLGVIVLIWAIVGLGAFFGLWKQSNVWIAVIASILTIVFAGIMYVQGMPEGDAFYYVIASLAVSIAIPALFIAGVIPRRWFLQVFGIGLAITGILAYMSIGEISWDMEAIYITILLAVVWGFMGYLLIFTQFLRRKVGGVDVIPEALLAALTVSLVGYALIIDEAFYAFAAIALGLVSLILVFLLRRGWF